VLSNRLAASTAVQACFGSNALESLCPLQHCIALSRLPAPEGELATPAMSLDQDTDPARNKVETCQGQLDRQRQFAFDTQDIVIAHLHMRNANGPIGQLWRSEVVFPA